MRNVSDRGFRSFFWAGLLLCACSDNGFKPASNQAAPAEKAPPGEGNQVPEPPTSLPPREPTPPTTTVPTPEPLSQLPAVITGTVDEQRFQSFKYGEPNPKVDYLFVLDNSSSMKQILQQVQLGFASLVQNNNVFSPDSQVAVMSTMIANPNDFTKTGEGVAVYTGIELEPGFIDFVDKASIVNYKAKVSTQANNWPIIGCNKKWFAPTDKDEMGNFCFTGATQSTNSSLNAEAGIHAFSQLFQKFKGKPLFRTGARVNVIFVSDTHDPGADLPNLVTTLPTYQKLMSAALVDNKIAALTFHAIAPKTSKDCSAESFTTTSYYTLVDASKGEKTDICTLADYGAFLSRMIARSKIVEPVFQLSLPPDKILQVLVNGQESKAFEIVGEKKDQLRINGLDPLKSVDIKVVFDPK